MARPPFLAREIPNAFSHRVGAAAGLAFINSIGPLGGFAGPYLMVYLKNATGTFLAGLLAMADPVRITLLSTALRLLITRE
jgi:hypothetical protein